MEISDEFRAAMLKVKAFHDQGLEETDACNIAFSRMIKLAPPEYLDVMSQQARDMGLLPQTTDLCDENGRPVYRIEDISKSLGISMDEINEIDRKMAEAGDPLLKPVNVYRKQ